jgi:hypothetical protein
VKNKFILVSFLVLAFSSFSFAIDQPVNPGTYQGNVRTHGVPTKKSCITVVKSSLYNYCQQSYCGTNVDVRITQGGYILATAISVDDMGINPDPHGLGSTSSTVDPTTAISGDVSEDFDTRGDLKSVTISSQDKWNNDFKYVTCEKLKLIGARKY